MTKELDSKRMPVLAGSMFSLWLVLLLSTWVGVGIGGIIIATAFLATSLVFSALTLGLGAILAIEAVAVATASISLILLFGFVIVPIGATLSAYIKLKFSDRFAVGDWALIGLPSEHALSSIVSDQSNRLGLSQIPRTMVMADIANAFAIRANERVSIVAIGVPVVQGLSRQETSAILGHELGHIICCDTQRKTYAMEFQEFLTTFFLFHGAKKFARWVLTPIAELLLLSLSRKREYWADAIGAALTSKEAMISALIKIHKLPVQHTRKEKLQSELMFLGVGRWFSTHPTLEQRIQALQSEKFLSRLPYRDYAAQEFPGQRPRPSLTSGI